MDMHADDKFTVAFDYASGATAERVQNPLWRLTEMFTGARMRESVAIVKAFGRRIVDKAVQDRASGPKSTTATAAAAAASDEVLDEISGSLIQSLLDSIGDKEMVADAALNYLSAGKMGILHPKTRKKKEKKRGLFSFPPFPISFVTFPTAHTHHPKQAATQPPKP